MFTRHIKRKASIRQQSSRSKLCRSAEVEARRGSTLLIVVALMGMLALLGVTFFFFASQENENAKNFNEAAKLVHDPELDPDVYFNWALRQLIVGPTENVEGNNAPFSALYGRRHSILPNAYGPDAHPHTGEGVHLAMTVTTDGNGTVTGLSAPFVDQDRNGSPDNDSMDFRDPRHPQFLLNLNNSPTANSDPNGNPMAPNTLAMPNPGVDYTYPDINNAFLAYVGKTRVQEVDVNGSGGLDSEDNNGNGVLDPGEDGSNGFPQNGILDKEDLNGNGVLDTAPVEVTVIKPSFWRPEVLRSFEQDWNGNGAVDSEDTNGNGILDPGEDGTNGFPADGFLNVEDFNGNGVHDTNMAFLDASWFVNPAFRNRTFRPHPGHVNPGHINDQHTNVGRYLDENNPNDQAAINAMVAASGGFPFYGPVDDTTGVVEPIRSGLWRKSAGQFPAGTQPQFDVDADGDGIREAILIDLGFPVQERPSDGALYVPMFAMTVYDADGLINLNIHGNVGGDAWNDANGVFGGRDTTLPPGIATIPISISSMGLSPAEVNPIWALDAFPPVNNQSMEGVTVSNEVAAFFNHMPGTLMNGDRFELANMEWFMLNKGFMKVVGSDPVIFSGRYGEANRLRLLYELNGQNATNAIYANDPTTTFGQTAGPNLFPFAGVWDRDDNRNRNEGGYGSSAFAVRHAWQHPIPVTGRGGFQFDPASGGKRLELVQPNNNRPAAWLAYDGVGMGDQTARWGSGLVPQGTQSPLLLNTKLGQLFVDPQSNILSDDPMEMTVEPRLSIRPFDEIFSVEDAAVLYMSNSAITLTGTTSRLTDLMPSNINPNNSDPTAVERRQRFTTRSFDRKQHGWQRFIPRAGVGMLGQNDSPGIDNFDDNRDGIRDNMLEAGWPGSDDARAWEFNVDFDRDGKVEFPPQFSEDRNGNGNLDRGEDLDGDGNLHNGVLAYTGFRIPRQLPSVPSDPFRAPVRRLLEVEFGNKDELKHQFRLNLNALLDVTRVGQNSGNLIDGPLEYRPLTPHATNLQGATSIPTVAPDNPLIAYPPQNGANAEFWARYDRQRLAKDIYVLLYTLCGDDRVNYLFDNDWTNPAQALHTESELKEMAQFAVNLVDAMDTDDVVTVFEYDKNLGDGWELDDQYWGPDASDQTAGGQGNGQSDERGVVFGVEAQKLTFSETLWIWQEEYPSGQQDNPVTPYDETMADYHALFIELANAAPEVVDLARSGGGGGQSESRWRIRRVEASGHTTSRMDRILDLINDGEFTHTGLTAPERAIYFRDSAGSVGAGNSFTIATSTDDSNNAGSDFWVDVNNTGGTANYSLIAPHDNGSTLSTNSMNLGNVAPNCNLDLTHASHANRFELEPAGGTTGDFLDATTAPGAGADDLMVLVLERRADLRHPQLPADENPWVTADVMVVERRQFDLKEMETSVTDVQGKLVNLKSTERQQPLVADTRYEQLHPGEPANQRHNSIDAVSRVTDRRNLTGRNPWDKAQMHFDRDFASLIELLSVPVYSPKTATRSIDRADLPAFRQLDIDVTQATHDSPGPFVASAKFLMPNPPNQNVGGGGGPPITPPGLGNGNGPPLVPPGLAKKQNRRNRWHRLLSILEVPTRTHRQLGSPFEVVRVPGKINMNTMRHAEVMGALIDDINIVTPPERDVNGNNMMDPFENFNGDAVFDAGLRSRITADRSFPGGPVRNWWFDFLASRDGLDPTTNLILPGTPSWRLTNSDTAVETNPASKGSKPFRDLSSAGYSIVYDDTGGGSTRRFIPSIEDTILRSDIESRDRLSGGSGYQEGPRRLFEVGTPQEADGSSTPVNHYLKNRILSKIQQNTTTRSNVFIVFIDVQFHEAVEDPNNNGAIRIGGRIDLNNDGNRDDGHNGFFIIDRSGAEEAYDIRRGEFDWRELVKHRLTIN